MPCHRKPQLKIGQLKIGSCGKLDVSSPSRGARTRDLAIELLAFDVILLLAALRRYLQRFARSMPLSDLRAGGLLHIAGSSYSDLLT